MRTEYKLLNESTVESERYKDIFTYLLPAFVRNRVKEGDREIAEDQGIVSVIFCDIVDFDSICTRYQP